MDKELFDDLISSCKEVLEYQKGNISLKTTELEVLDDELNFYSVYKTLSEVDKQKAMNYVSELARA